MIYEQVQEIFSRFETQLIAGISFVCDVYIFANCAGHSFNAS